ncbi:MAG: alpha/beta hydrolase family protein [Candidatus Kariarchaeaceae archaeon]|jgi:alpha/beta superfamily hydrolase
MQTSLLNDARFSGVSHIFYLPEINVEALVIRMHGLPGKSPHQEHELMGKLLTDVGVAYFAFDFPGIRESKGYYTYRNAFNLAKTILDYFIYDHEDIYPKIGIYGESFGGSISVSLSYKNSSISSLFLWSPVLHFQILSKQLEMKHIIRFMEDSGVVRLPIYDDIDEAFSTQMNVNPPEASHLVFNRIPVRICASEGDILFPPSVIRKQLASEYHSCIQEVPNLDHNLNRRDAANKLASIAQNFFIETLL